MYNTDFVVKSRSRESNQRGLGAQTRFCISSLLSANTPLLSLFALFLMSSTQIYTLLQPPDVNESNARALAYLNSHFKSLDDLEKESDLEGLVEQAQLRLEDFDTKVRCIVIYTLEDTFYRTLVVAQLAQSQTSLNRVIARTRKKATENLHTAQELSLLRHSLADELSFLSGELESSLSANPDDGPTLLEDLETLHRSLKELDSVKGYVRVIEHALKLRCVVLFRLYYAAGPQHEMVHVVKPPWTKYVARIRRWFRNTRSCRRFWLSSLLPARRSKPS